MDRPVHTDAYGRDRAEVEALRDAARDAGTEELAASVRLLEARAAAAGLVGADALVLEVARDELRRRGAR